MTAQLNLPGVIKSLENMANYFGLLVKTEEEKGNFVLTFDDSKGNDLLSVKILKFNDGTYSVYEMDEKNKLSVTQVYDKIYDKLNWKPKEE